MTRHFAERMVKRNERLFERTLSAMSDERSVVIIEGANTSTQSTLWPTSFCAKNHRGISRYLDIPKADNRIT